MTESELQSKIMIALYAHPLVAWAYVTSTGTFRGMGGGRPIKIGFPGMADILGQLKDGRSLAIEVKLPGKTPTDEQFDFLDTVSTNGGLGFWADSVGIVLYTLDNANITPTIFHKEQAE